MSFTLTTRSSPAPVYCMTYVLCTSVVLIKKGLMAQLFSLPSKLFEELPKMDISNSIASVSVHASLNLLNNERPINEPSTILRRTAHLVVYAK